MLLLPRLRQNFFLQKAQTERIVDKKIVLFIFSIILFASCSVRKQTVSPAGKPSGTQQEILNYGMKYLNTPYRYAGRGPHAFDCSGFTSFVFREFGYKLSASSSGQGKQVPSINSREDLRTGDLVFFEGRANNGRIGHVGIVKDLLPGGEFTFLHASTSYGVIVSRSTEEYYATRYLHGGRVLNENNQVVVAKSSKKETPQQYKSDLKSKKQKSNSDISKMALVKVTPKTETEQQIESSAKQDIRQDNSSQEKTIIHSRPSYLPPFQTQKNSSKNVETTPTISKDVRRSSNTNVPKPDVSSKTIAHKVQQGDTLYSIAQKYGCTVEQLRIWNSELTTVIKPGEVVMVKK